MPKTHRRAGNLPDRHRRETGQTLVEFALVFPIFLLLVLAVIEFAFVFSGMLGISYATRDAGLIAAEAGDTLGADCVIIKTVDQAVSAPADDSRIQSIFIYRADQNGVEMSGVSSQFNRITSGPLFDCGDGTTIPYARMTNGYPEASRCNVLVGCGSGHPGLDTIGVRVVYIHRWVTPLGGFGANGFGGQGGSGFTLTQSNSMRMEPIL